MGTRGSSHAQERRYPLAATFGQSNKSRKLDDPIKDGIFPQAVPPGRPALGHRGRPGGEFECHRACRDEVSTRHGFSFYQDGRTKVDSGRISGTCRWKPLRASVFLEAKVTEGVSIDDYSTYRATRFADPI